MRRFEREVREQKLIEEMMKLFDTLYVGLTDERCPYVVPMSFGFEIKNHQLLIYVHCALKGHKLKLLEQHPFVSITLSQFKDFPDCKYKGHYHDYRSVMGCGLMEKVDPHHDFATYKHAFELLYTCNQREVKPLDPHHLPPMHIYTITCDMDDVTAKSEFPIRKQDDVSFIDVHQMPQDDIPFDLTDIIQSHHK